MLHCHGNCYKVVAIRTSNLGRISSIKSSRELSRCITSHHNCFLKIQTLLKRFRFHNSNGFPSTHFQHPEQHSSQPYIDPLHRARAHTERAPSCSSRIFSGLLSQRHRHRVSHRMLKHPSSALHLALNACIQHSRDDSVWPHAWNVVCEPRNSVLE